ncbi:hypothetical protein [Paenibacillus sp. Leaf72]|uniref:hypothetical protein n=1 Tax=Paenibacillus sp. Leaf72 TaxID=1736234 RepID=UPI0006F644A9|nr:hypothetical protein [Paenibacillus sp. Leaf72]KQN96923.1 hypothetical protein ASF12_22910 [Paenibacillus sp. Leaf72]
MFNYQPSSTEYIAAFASLYIVAALTIFFIHSAKIHKKNLVIHNKIQQKEISEKLDQERELKRLQGIEQALQDFDMPYGTAKDVFDWLESETGYRREQEGISKNMGGL